MEIDENKRPTVAELANLPYFRRIQGKDPFKLALPLNTASYGSAFDLRLRSPSYADPKMLKSEQAVMRRKISADKPSMLPPSFKNQSDIPKGLNMGIPSAGQQGHRNFLDVNE